MKCLVSISWHSCSAAKYALEFRTLPAGSGWNESVLKAAFYHSLNEDILTEIAWRDEKFSLDFLINLSIHLDKLLQKQIATCKKLSLMEEFTTPEHMQVTQTHLNAADRERREETLLLLRVGQSHHPQVLNTTQTT